MNRKPKEWRVRVGGVAGAGWAPGRVRRAPGVPLWAALLAGLLGLLGLVGAVRAQESPLGTRTAGLKVEVESPGVGGVSRNGSLVGVRVQITDTSINRRNVAVRLVLRDSDGDYFAPARVVPLTPGVAQPVWVYTWLPPDADSRPLMLGVYPIAGDGGVESAILDEPLARIDLGDSRSTAGKSLKPTDQSEVQLLRIGNSPLGLSRYFSASAQGPGGVGGQTSAGAMQFLHEPMHLLSVPSPAGLPDNWMGLAPIATIVWGAGEPGDLKGAYAQAVREWLYHGGHLVVVLPSAGQTWIGPVGHELADLMPEVDAVRRDGADLSPYLSLLTRQTTAISPEALKGVVYELRPRAGSAPEKAVPILAGPKGDCVVVRRSVGSGAITVVGFDLTRQSALNVDADVFWHRVLGTRGQLLNQTEASGVQMSSRSPVNIDGIIKNEVNKGEQANMAVLGVFLGLVVFALYWVAAGPGSYAVLKRMGLTRHAWVAFTAMAGVFTVIAWGGAWMFKPGKTKGTHVTLYEHVYGQPFTRSRSFLSVMLPWYGEARIGVGGMDGRLETGAKRQLRNVVVPWSTGAEGAGAEGAFPDTRDYVMDVTNPSSLAFPVRSTVKQLLVDWAGGTLWRTPYPVTDAGEPGGEIKVEEVQGLGSSRTERLTGRLKHGLPGPLENITVFYVARQRRLTPRPVVTEGWQAVVEGGWVVSPPDLVWKPGETLDLAVLEASVAKDRVAAAWVPYLDAKVRQTGGGYTMMTDEPKMSMPLMMQLLTVSGQLGVPRVDEKQKVSEEQKFQAHRQWTQGWDGSRWMTQPCLIIIGELKGASATPLFVDGRELATEGSTWVRWIYPLPGNPPAWPETMAPTPAGVTPAEATPQEPK